MNKRKYSLWIVEFLCITAITAIIGIPSIGYLWLFLPIMIILFVKIVEYRTETEEKYLKVYWQLQLIYNFLSFDKDADVRCVFHVPVIWRGLLQTTGYIPTGSGKGRIFPFKKGIIGKAYSQKKTSIVNFKDDEEYREMMVSEYGYTVKEIVLRTADRRSYLCLPLVDDANQKVFGLVYFDSCKPDYFSDFTNLIVNNIREKIRVVRASII